MDDFIKKTMIDLLNHFFDKQSNRLFLRAQEIVPNITPEDVLQPMDNEKLEGDGLFRFEEGVLFGIGELRAAIFACLKDYEELLQKERSEM